jgi:hypothetical protein
MYIKIGDVVCYYGQGRVDFMCIGEMVVCLG